MFNSLRRIRKLKMVNLSAQSLLVSETLKSRLSPRIVKPFSACPVFDPKKILVLTKLSRYDFEKHTHSELSEAELARMLHRRGSDYKLLLYHHNIHKGVESAVLNTLNEAGIETRLVTRFDYTTSNIEWADAIVTTGGDGTYLLAATRVLNQDKPVIGFNSDPLKSKGHLCLPKKYSVYVKEAINKLLKGKFRWTFRRRIRVTLIGDKIFEPPVELHEQELQHPENRYLDIEPQLPTIEDGDTGTERRVLPILALNEVFIGECVSARVSYMEISFDSSPTFKLKSSGLIASTGTGSTSWTYSINKLTEQNLEDILSIIKEESRFPISDSDPFIKTVTDKFNERLIISPEEARMVYTIRDQIPSFPVQKDHKPRGFARTIGVKSRMFDAALVIDGGMSFRFNDGTRAILEVKPEDALLTATLLEHSEVHKH